MELSPSNLGAWETEDEMSTPALPTLMRPVDVRPSSQRASRTPSRGSRRSRRSVTPPGRISASPPQVPGSDKTDKSDRVMRDLATDEKISILDPRRFTPTLHANLVAEILSLKRDREEKLKVIENLESTLQSTRDEEDDVQTTLQNTARENRSLKRQLALLEGGTSSALGELARERDEAVDAAAEARRRLETMQKRLKTQEESAEQIHEQWDNDKDEWDEERRKTDRKIHVLETRLKTVLEEMAAYHAAAIEGQMAEEDDLDDKGRDSDTGSIRSMTVRGSLRFSLAQQGLNGHSLADELNFDDDSDGQTEPNGRDSVLSNYRHARTDSRASTRSRTHRRHHSGESLIRPGSVARGRFQKHGDGILANDTIHEDEEAQRPAPPKVSYTDTGIQYSPPPSPKLAPASKGPEPRGVPALAARWEKHHEEISTEANSRRKRISIARPLSIQTPPPVSQKLMVSAAAQTADVPLSPPKTPKSPVQEQPPIPMDEQAGAMVSAGTQTDPPAPPRPVTPPPAATIAIPSISIHPPTNRPTSPRAPRLPQLQKDFGCQVSIPAVPMTSSGVQTEEIRIDQRLDMLPRHLHPSTVTSRPTTPAESQNTNADPDRGFTPVPGHVPPRNPRRLTSLKSVENSPRGSLDMETKETKEDVALSEKAASRRSRISSLFASVHDASSGDEMVDFGDDAEQSDSEYRTALSAPRAVKSPEPGRSTPGSIPTSPDDVMPVKAQNDQRPASPLGTTSIFNSYRLSGGDTATPKRHSSKAGLRPSAMSNPKAGGMRKAAMIQSGIHTHQEEAADPPFPIPARASSRQPLFSAGAPDGRNPSPVRNEPWHRKGTRTSINRNNSLRKSRSAAAVSYNKNRSNRRKASRSPPYSPEVPSTPTVPPLPANVSEFTTPKNDRRGRGHRHQNSGTTATTEATAFTGMQSNESSQGANGVVDAIAQTMVGEWMFKYVRRRKSFTLGSDNSGRDDSSNDRHKRWVWLAPYERAILWSSKQPSSGSALLGGKSGRKRKYSRGCPLFLKGMLTQFAVTIQSVLDVKDDNPPPKGPQAVFNRSILILTPQRALKFTAINADRHYLWLTALSFLAHSQQDVPEMPTPTPMFPQQVPDLGIPPPPPSNFSRTRKPRIRDSIRLAKSQTPVVKRTPAARPVGGIANTMSSQGSTTRVFNDRTISPMPSIPDVPTSLVPGFQRSVSATAASDTAGSSYSHPSNANSHHNNATNAMHQRDESIDAAEPPVIQRFGRDPPPPMPAPGPAFHGRKRSNTGGGRVPPPLSFRGFAGPGPMAVYGGGLHAPTNSGSTNTGSSDMLYLNSSHGGPRSSIEPGAAAAWPSGRTSEGSSEYNRDSMHGRNLFEAIGTVRMEAFISPLAYSRYENDGQLNYPDPLEEQGRARARKMTKEARRRKSRSRSRSRTRESFSRGGVAAWREEYFGGGHGHGLGHGRGRGRVPDGYRTAGEEGTSGRRDPFEGF